MNARIRRALLHYQQYFNKGLLTAEEVARLARKDLAHGI